MGRREFCLTAVVLMYGPFKQGGEHTSPQMRRLINNSRLRMRVGGSGSGGRHRGGKGAWFRLSGGDSDACQ
ncbi:MAG: hypothetical protein CM15mP74_15970 [Halieaceae bacterium]|nr:MAG: hypothetical protein CM15mP74_15970 [Halieaceae bacterium]